MLTRESLKPAEWRDVRDTPHHVIVAVSVSGGSPFDEMLERKAGLQAVVDAMHSSHPLLRDIAVAENIMKAQTDVRDWYYTLPEEQRTAATLRAKALESMGRALDAIDGHGTPQDRLHYVEFIVALANRVAMAAREGDLLGVGGKLVSADERHFIERLQSLAQPRPA
jgi:hypothetical protein